jgi:hypothetical protein
VVGIEPHVPAAVVVPPVVADADELAAELAGALDDAALDAAAALEELDELDEQAARPRPVVRARAAMPPVDTALALIYVSFDGFS